MRISKIIIAKRIITLIQVLILIPPVLLQYLSDRKMGVMRYLVFKKDMFSKEIFTSSSTFIYIILLFLGAICCIIFLLYSYIRKKNVVLIKPIFVLFLLNVICLYYAFSFKFKMILSYHFFLIAFFIIIILQFIKIIIIASDNKFA